MAAPADFVSGISLSEASEPVLHEDDPTAVEGLLALGNLRVSDEVESAVGIHADPVTGDSLGDEELDGSAEHGFLAGTIEGDFHQPLFGAGISHRYPIEPGPIR